MKTLSVILESMQFDSIERRLSAIAVIFIMGTAITMGCMGIWLTHKFVKQRFHDNFIVLSEYLARNAELGVLLKNREMLDNLTNNMLQQEDIVKVIIKDAAGNTITGTDREHIQTYDDNSEYSDKRVIGADRTPPAAETVAEKDSVVKINTAIFQIQPDHGEMAIYNLNSSRDIIGYVELYYTPSGLRALTKEMTFLFMAISFVLSFVSLAWYWFFARAITSPLVNLVAVSRRVSQGDLDIRASGGELRETKTLAKVFNEMLDSLKEHQRHAEKMHMEMAKQKSLAEIGKFSTMVAHELKNPISIIKGSIDIFKKKSIDERTRGTMLLYVDEEIQRLNRLVDEFLLFAKPKKPILSKVSMSYFLSEVIEKLKFTVPEKTIKISIDVEDAPVECDLVLMERAMLNILKNAVEHSSPFIVHENSVMDSGENHVVELDQMSIINSPEISVKYDADIEVRGRSELQGSAYIIEINDRGRGIDESIIDDIFNPFFSTRAKGTGLGLSIVRDIVAVHNGTVVVRNRPSGGASFEIKIMAHAVPSFFLK